MRSRQADSKKRLGWYEYPGWSESLVGAQVISLFCCVLVQLFEWSTDRLFEVGLAKTFSLNVRVSFAIEYKCNVDIDF